MKCPSCGLDSGLYRDFKGTLQCDNCGWVGGEGDLDLVEDEDQP